MAHESEAVLLQAGVRAGLLDPEKGTAALVVFAELRRRGARLTFGEFLVERGLLSRMSLEGLERNLRDGGAEAVRTISRLGDFELLDLLGEGESGSVFRARQISLDRPVAVKILAPRLAEDPEALRRFLDEARISARLRHPHLVQCFRVATVEGLYYFAMELVDGGSARMLLKASGGRLSEDRALTIAAQIAAALSAAHAAGLVHHDVKPENILLTRDGRAKLADLGIAVRRSATATGAGEFWGTPAYVAPEVSEGRVDNDPRSDLYSLGAVLFEFLVGRPPFQAATPEELLRMHVIDPPPDVGSLRPDLSPQTSALVMRLLAKDPAQRFPDARSLVESIQLVIQLRLTAPLAELPARRPAVARPRARTSGNQPASRAGRLKAGAAPRRGLRRRK